LESGACLVKRRTTEGRVVVITGCSSGIGLLAAVAFASRGFRVAATMRDTRRSEPLLLAARKAGCAERVTVMELDVRKPEQAREAIERVARQFGRLDIVVNNAGYALGGFTEEVPLDSWRELLETNVLGAITVTQAALPAMRAQRSGLIINIGSISGRIGLPGFGPYAASKFALEGFSESLRHELAPWGIRVAIVEPGAYSTDIWRKGLDSLTADEASPYAGQLAKLLARTRATAEAAPHPEAVARTLVRIAMKRNPRLRYPVGRGIRAALLAKLLLPWNLYEALLRRLM
jgi:NAD(P)-dependent dehydrogenase (short-subunit alcohol dehydrogenase family)